MTDFRPYTPQDRDAVQRLNAEYYTSAHGFDASFPTVMSAALDKIDPAVEDKTGAGWVAIDSNQIAGSLFMTPDGTNAGRIRLFLLRPDLQGRGLGADLLAECLTAAGPLGFATVRVSTFTIHDAACRLYLKSGFQQGERADCHMFGRDLVQIDFSRSA